MVTLCRKSLAFLPEIVCSILITIPRHMTVRTRPRTVGKLQTSILLVTRRVGAPLGAGKPSVNFNEGALLPLALLFELAEELTDPRLMEATTEGSIKRLPHGRQL